VQALSEADQHAVTFLQRHVTGDWGEIGHLDQTELTEDEQRRGWEATEDDAKINKFNLFRGSDSILGASTTSRGTRLWVMTYLKVGTTVLLPEER
jgi:hypothetical protein